MLLTYVLHSATIDLTKGEMKMIDTHKVKVRMMEKEINQKKLATLMGMAQSTLSQKINNSRPMNLEEAEEMSKLLNISQEEFSEYFFSR